LDWWVKLKTNKIFYKMTKEKNKNLKEQG